MKAIAGILKYFLLFNPSSMIAVPFILVMSTLALILLINSQDVWELFLLIGTMQATATGLHLRFAVRCSGTELLPHHRKYHLITAGGIFTITFFLSTVALPFAVISPWSSISFYLLFSALGLWLSYLTPTDDGSQNTLFLLFTMMMMAVLKNTSNIYSVAQALPHFGPLYIIIISLLSLIFFCRYFLKGHHVVPNNPSRWRDNLAAMAKGDLDLVDFRSRWITSKLISRLARKNVSSGLTRLLRIGLFSPAISGGLLEFGTIFLCLFVILWLNLPGTKLLGRLAFDTLPIICVLATGMLTTDIFSHRTRIPTLYLQSRFPSRRAFIDTLLRCYLSLIGKQLAFVVLIFALIITMRFGLRPDVWNHMLQALFLGLSMSLGWIAVFLIYCRRIKSMETLWILFFILFVVVALLIVVDNWYGYSIWIIVPMIVALCLFRYAVRRWSDDEIGAFFDAL